MQKGMYKTWVIKQIKLDWLKVYSILFKNTLLHKYFFQKLSLCFLAYSYSNLLVSVQIFIVCH